MRATEPAVERPLRRAGWRPGRAWEREADTSGGVSGAVWGGG